VLPMPYVDAEVHRLTVALRGVSLHLSGALKALSELPLSSVATRTADGAVEAARSSLTEALGHLRTAAEDAAAVTARHSVAVQAPVLGADSDPSGVGQPASEDPRHAS
jgi:hypothetical protein